MVKLLDQFDAAFLLGTTTRQVRAFVRERRLPVVLLPHSREPRFLPDDIERFVAEYRQPASAS